MPGVHQFLHFGVLVTGVFCQECWFADTVVFAGTGSGIVFLFLDELGLFSLLWKSFHCLLAMREVRLGGVTQETLTADWAWHRVRHSDPQTEHTEMLIRRQQVDKCGDLIK